jgi:DNA repair protein RecO (recombination protein O)
MSQISTPAIVLRRREYGDFDMILVLLTAVQGKVAMIAKSAKKSTKRFGGVLELFSILDVVARRGKGMPMLTEASLRHPLPNIRCSILKTAYASYWAELSDTWLEDGIPQPLLFELLCYTLAELDRGQQSADMLSILFQMRFLSLAGLQPDLSHCRACESDVEDWPQTQVAVDPAQGSVVCETCVPWPSQQRRLSKGTIKQLQWIAEGKLNKAVRAKFSATAISEALTFLEAFVPYHLGREFRSLKFLRQIRD